MTTRKKAVIALLVAAVVAGGVFYFNFLSEVPSLAELGSASLDIIKPIEALEKPPASENDKEPISVCLFDEPDIQPFNSSIHPKVGVLRLSLRTSCKPIKDAVWVEDSKITAYVVRDGKKLKCVRADKLIEKRMSIPEYAKWDAEVGHTENATALVQKALDQIASQ